MALRHLRRSEIDLILWVDAVCIDQTSERERNQQVGQMDRVYSTAENVLVWLGPGNQGIDALMEMTRALDHRVSRPAEAPLDDWRAAWADLFRERGGTASALHDARIQALTDLLRRPWFSRIWVVQEVALAQQANLVCGWSRAPARAFALMPALLGVDVGPHISALLDVMPGPLRHSSWWARRRDLFTMLQKFGRRASTDPRDRIYALFGIASDMSITKAIKPRYGEDVSEAVVDVIRFLLFGDVSSASKLEFPKWTVDELLATLEGDNVDILTTRLLEWSLSTDADSLTEKLLGREKLDVNSPRVGEAGQPVLHYLASRPPHPKYILFLKTIVDQQDLVDVNLLAPGEPPQALASGRILNLLLSRDFYHTSTVALALSEAVEHQADAAAKNLIARGADINRARPYRAYPLRKAIERDNLKMVSLMLKHNPDAINADLEGGWRAGTPLCVAAELGKLNVARVLIAMGANIEIESPWNGGTPLFIAARWGYTEIVNILLEYGANIEARTTGGSTPLWIASSRGHDAVVKALIRRGADIEAKDFRTHGTPLWVAAYKGHAKAVKRLLDAGADLTARGREDGRILSTLTTPREIASVEGHKEVLEILPVEA
ncbi:hypothetical protein MAPG_09353 [Magnaporthiopsis poae ATCC 64411]|uniref:Heterokaryon incompatibility domain-containing protein n=1 Tax=Magnaporthiopsis poae (strain ATCC 64411 / 73-15) TaxID=644358 RepID=A0A0C4E9Q7_MAGP6|nr:hypothetical protein MAPG_09353 [Magnaporthiopsis poae ATCC 64411]